VEFKIEDFGLKIGAFGLGYPDLDPPILNLKSETLNN
jgi:hypothetical protein